MKSVLVTGGTTFVSRYIAEYFVKQNYMVYVLNRNTKPQSEGVILIEADKYNLGNVLKPYEFDLVVDTSYNAKEVGLLLDALGTYKEYIFISSSAVYPENEKQPFKEESSLGMNKYWKQYGIDKIEAEKLLQERVPNAYILRPPYLYGQMNNVYREAFVFDCAMQNRKFYLPEDGNMKLQFFHVDDLCRLIKILHEDKPKDHIYNVGNKETITVKEWVNICYEIASKTVGFENVYEDIEQRNYFPFYDYEYCLDTTKSLALLKKTIPLKDGLKEAYEWYIRNDDKVNKREYINYIDNNI